MPFEALREFRDEPGSPFYRAAGRTPAQTWDEIHGCLTETVRTVAAEARLSFQRGEDFAFSPTRTLRALGNRWLEVLWHCLHKDVLNDETIHTANRKRTLQPTPAKPPERSGVQRVSHGHATAALRYGLMSRPQPTRKPLERDDDGDYDPRREEVRRMLEAREDDEYWEREDEFAVVT